MTENAPQDPTNVNRRSFLRIGTEGALAGCAARFATPVFANRTSPPNIVFIICDQMRGDALGCRGNPNARTPNLDRLASDGVLCENHFSNSPVCVPSRMSLFAGQYPHRTGRLSNIAWDSPKLSVENTLLGAFQKKGYRIGWVGKNHTYTKDALGAFDFTSIRAREPFRKYSRFVPPFWHGDTLWPEEECHPRKNTDEAIQFIRESEAGEPFFLHVSYFDPHPPYMAPSEYTCRYSSSQMSLPDSVQPSQLSERLDIYSEGMRLDEMKNSDLSETLRYYFASIEWGVDRQVGEIMKALESKGILENTIILFTSDHGDFMGDYHMVRKGMFLYDSLLHVPMIWYAPGHIQNGARLRNLTQGIDIFPTLLDLTEEQNQWDLDGRSLKSFLQGDGGVSQSERIFTSGAYGDVDPNVTNPSLNLDDEDETPLHTRIMRQGMQPTFRTKMIRTHQWKFILNESDPPELYSLKPGRKERKNVALRDEFNETRRTLEKELTAWWPWEA